MKKTEAISILATSVRPREAKDRARYDEAVKMAIEALRCSEIPNSSDSISRQAALDAITDELMPSTPLSAVIRVKNRLKELPSAQSEIIRCRNCRWNDGTCYCEFHYRDVKADDYCSWAERRTDE